MSGERDRLERARRDADELLAKPFHLEELVWPIGTLYMRRLREL